MNTSAYSAGPQWPQASPRQPRYVLWAVVISFGLLTIILAMLFWIGWRSLKQTDALIGHVHQQLREGKLEEVVAEADPEIANKPELLRDVLLTVQQSQGKPVSTQRLTWHRTSNEKGSFLACTYLTTYEKGFVTESFTFRIRDRRPRLYYYHAELPESEEEEEADE